MRIKVLRDLRYWHLWLLCGLAMVLTVLLGSLLPTVPALEFQQSDKVNHLVAYIMMTAWFTALVQRSRYWLIVTGLVLFGIGVEVAQASMHLGRDGDWRDVVANCIGIAAGLALAFSSRESWLTRLEKWIRPPI